MPTIEVSNVRDTTYHSIGWLRGLPKPWIIQHTPKKIRGGSTTPPTHQPGGVKRSHYHQPASSTAVGSLVYSAASSARPGHVPSSEAAGSGRVPQSPWRCSRECPTSPYRPWWPDRRAQGLRRRECPVPFLGVFGLEELPCRKLASNFRIYDDVW